MKMFGWLSKTSLERFLLDTLDYLKPAYHLTDIIGPDITKSTLC